jgi:hypothetical protein
LKHTETNNILAVAQFGFRTSSSTKKASYKLTDDILNAINNRMMVGGNFATYTRLSIALITTHY